MSRELRHLRVKEISAVDRPANRRRFLMIKRVEDGMSDPKASTLR